jgi:hypothetical protein
MRLKDPHGIFIRAVLAILLRLLIDPRLRLVIVCLDPAIEVA